MKSGKITNSSNNKRYIVLGSACWYELDNRWVVASFSSRGKAEEWCKRCNYYGQWVSKMEKASFEERRLIDRSLLDEGKINWDSAVEVDATYPETQWKWSIDGSTVQGELCLKEAFGEEDYSDAEYEIFHKAERAERGWMLNPYDHQIADNISQGISYEVVEVEDDPLLPSEPYP